MLNRHIFQVLITPATLNTTTPAEINQVFNLPTTIDELPLDRRLVVGKLRSKLCKYLGSKQNRDWVDKSTKFVIYIYICIRQSPTTDFRRGTLSYLFFNWLPWQQCFKKNMDYGAGLPDTTTVLKVGQKIC